MAENQPGLFEDKAEVVTITLTRHLIPCLLGAARLGIWLESWCAMMYWLALDHHDSGSMKWCNSVNRLTNEIKQQTGITEEYKEYGEAEQFIDIIEKFVGDECDRYHKESKERRLQNSNPTAI